MQRIVSNATPLIYLSKADQLILLHDMFKETLVPEAVYREVVIQGKHREENDAFRIDRAIRDGWIRVKGIKEIYHTELSIHPGEVEVISLAREMGIKIILMDDIKARTAAEMAGLTPKGTLWLLLKAVKMKILDFEQFLLTLEDIVRSGFYLKEDVFLKAVHKAKNLSVK
ncbi:MAG: hypothetical protein ABIJ44_06290 [Pseudomonadota bacterium]